MILILFIFLVAAYLLLRKTEEMKAIFYAAALLFQVVWIIAFIIGAFSTRVQDKIFWDTTIIIALMGILTCYLLFTLEFNGFQFHKHKIFYYVIIGVAIAQMIPVCIFIDHPLFRYDYWTFVIFEQFSVLRNETGWYLNIVAVESLILGAVPLGLFIRNFFLKSKSKLVKNQSLMIIISFLLITFLFLMFNWGFGLLDYSLIINLVVFTAANLLIFIAIFPLRTFEVLPAGQRTILSNMGDGYVIFSRKGILMEINTELMNLLGIFDKNEVFGKTPSKVFTQYPKLMAFTKSFREGTIEIPLARWDEAVHFEVKKVNFYRLKRYVGFILIFHNITDRKEYEQNLMESKEDLEQKFQHAQKLDSIGQLAGGIAHEFNNILTVILGNTQLMELTEHVHADDRILLDEISEAAKSASRLTKQLLTIGRKNIIHPTVIDVNSNLERMEELFYRLIGKDDIKIELKLNPDCGNVFADKGLLEQIMINLVVNAKDAMPNGGKLEIATECLHVDDDNKEFYPEADTIEYSCISVHDSGVGMHEEVLQHLFEPFFTTKPRGRGTGLGLSMVLGAIQQFQGFVKVDSESGKGSTFRIYIPTSMEERIPQEEEIPKVIRGNGELIILVEDDPSVRTTTLGMVKGLGYDVMSFSSGQEALNGLKMLDREIALLFTDVVMQGMKGNELFEEMKKIYPKLKVLFASGYTDKIIAQYGILYKDTYFLPKPFTLTILAQKIHEILHA